MKTCTIEVMNVYGKQNVFSGNVSYRGKLLFKTNHTDTVNNLLDECKQYATTNGFSHFKGFIENSEGKLVKIEGRFE